MVTKVNRVGTQTKVERRNRSRASRSSSRTRSGKKTEQTKDDGDQTREGTAEGTPTEISITMNYQESSESSDEGGPGKVLTGKEDSNSSENHHG